MYAHEIKHQNAHTYAVKASQHAPVTIQQLEAYKVHDEHELERIESAVSNKSSPELISNEIC